MEAIHEAPAAPSTANERSATGKKETSPVPKEALTQWIVDTLVAEVVSDITADGLMNRVLQSDATAERVEALTGQLKQKLRAHIEQKALDELEAEFAGDLEVLNRWPEAEAVSPEISPALPSEDASATPPTAPVDADAPTDPPASEANADVPQGAEASAELPNDTGATDVAVADATPAPAHEAPEQLAPQKGTSAEGAPEDEAQDILEVEEAQQEDEASATPRHTESAPLDSAPGPEMTNGQATEQWVTGGIKDGAWDQQHRPDAEEVVEDLVESFGAFPDEPDDDGAPLSHTPHPDAIDDTRDASLLPTSLLDVSHEEEDEAPEASAEAVGADERTPAASAPDASTESVNTAEDGPPEERPPYEHTNPASEQKEGGAPPATAHDEDGDMPAMEGDAPHDAVIEEEGATTASPAAEEPDFSPIDWDAAADADAFEASTTDPVSEPLTAENGPQPMTDDDVALEEAFFDGDFFPDIAAAEDDTSGSATTGAPPGTPGAPIDADEILFARALIGGTPEARASLRKTFTHADYRLVEWPAYDVLVEAVGIREEDEDGAGGDTLAKVAQRIPGSMPVIPLRDAHPTQSMDELCVTINEVDGALHEALFEQSAQEAWHMSVLMDKEEVRRYVVDHHAPVREHLNEMRGKPQGVARFIKKKMVESINEEVARLADECTDAVAVLMEEHGNDVTEVAHTPGREGDYYHLAQFAGLFDKESEDALVALTSELVETYGMYGFIFRPEGPSSPRHFSMVFPDAKGER